MQRERSQRDCYRRLVFCTGYWLTRSSWLPRPASPASTSKVETVHPHGFSMRIEALLHHYVIVPINRITPTSRL